MKISNIAEFDVMFQVHGLLLAGLPANENGLKYTLEHAPYPRADVPGEGHDIAVEELSPDEEEIEQQLNRFRRREIFNAAFPGDKKKLCIDEHIVQGILREAVTLSGLSGLPRGIFKKCFTQPRIIPLEKPEGGYFAEEDVVVETRRFPGMTPRGPRNVVVRHEALLDPIVRFRLLVMPGANSTKARAEIKAEALAQEIKELFQFAAEFGGIGGGRRKSSLEYDYGIFSVDFPASA